MTRLVAAALLLCLATPATATAQVVLTVEAPGSRVTFTAADLAALPHDTLRTSAHADQPAHLFSGIPVHALLARVGVRADSLRGPALRMRVVVDAADGYRVVLALAEVDPSVTDRRALLADAVDGHPLPPSQAPLQLVLAGDPRHSRWVRQVIALRVRAEVD